MSAGTLYYQEDTAKIYIELENGKQLCLYRGQHLARVGGDWFDKTGVVHERGINKWLDADVRVLPKHIEIGHISDLAKLMENKLNDRD